MIKKMICGLICVILFLPLFGCDGYRETDDCYIVSAVGFDKAEDIKIFLEVISAGGGERSGTTGAEIISGQGEDPESAMFLLTGQTSKILLFDHCTALVIGDGIKNGDFDEIMNFARELKEINPSVYITRTESAKKIFNDSRPVSVARGFDIAGNIGETEKDTGIKYENRFFELYSAYESNGIYKIPFLDVKNSRIIIEGEAIYRKNERRDLLTNEESLIYSFFINRNSGGKIYFGKEYADISRSRFSYKGDKYVADMHIKNESDGFERAFKKKCDEFLIAHRKNLDLKSGETEIKAQGGA